MKSTIFNFTDEVVSTSKLTFNEAEVINITDIDTRNIQISKLEIRGILDKVSIDPLDSECIVVFKMAPVQIAGAFMIATAMSQANIPCKMWISEKGGGKYIPIDDYFQEGYDWAMQRSHWFREQEIVSEFNV